MIISQLSKPPSRPGCTWNEAFKTVFWTDCHHRPAHLQPEAGKGQLRSRETPKDHRKWNNRKQSLNAFVKKMAKLLSRKILSLLKQRFIESFCSKFSGSQIVVEKLNSPCQMVKYATIMHSLIKHNVHFTTTTPIHHTVNQIAHL